MSRLPISDFRFQIVLFACFACFAVSSSFSYPLRWSVETSRPANMDISYTRGEIVTLQPTFLSYGDPIDVTYTAVYLNYRGSGMTNAFTPIAGAIVNGTNGEVSVTIETSCFSTQRVYAFEIYVVGPSIGMKRAAGRILVQDSITDNGTTNLVPATQSTIDWATTSQENVDQSGFVSALNIAMLEAFKSNCLSGDADLNVHTITGAHIGDASGLTNFPDAVATNFVDGGASDTPSITYIGSNTWRIVWPQIASGETLSTNRLVWAVSGRTVGYVATNGITMLHGSLNLFEEDLNCNVQAYDGSAAAPSVTWYSDRDTGQGWHRRSWYGLGAWAYSCSSQDLAIVGADGITLLNGAAYRGDGSKLTGAEPLFTTFNTNPILPSLSIRDPSSNELFAVNHYTGAAKIRGQDSDARYNLGTNGFTGTNVFYTVNSNGTGVITNTWIFIGGQRRQ